MKRTFTIMVVAMLSLAAFTTQAQQNKVVKKPLFKSLPGRVSCKEADLNKVFSATQGRNYSVTFSPELTLSGTIVSNVVKYKNLQCITMKLPAYGDAVFGLSKRIDENNKVIYSGHIINNKASDAYELQRTATGEYQLVKINLETILQDCAQH